jgi:hypothetical protein
MSAEIIGEGVKNDNINRIISVKGYLLNLIVCSSIFWSMDIMISARNAV